MTETLNFELVSPEEKLVSEPVKMAVIPGEEGELGVGANHASFVVSLQPGVVRLYKGDDNIHSLNASQEIFITGGFADISAAGCSVLAEEAIPVGQLNREALTKELTNLEEDLGIAVEKTDKARVAGKISIVKAKLQAAA